MTVPRRFGVLRFIGTWEPWHTAIFAAYAMIVFLELFIPTRRTKPPVE